MITSISLSRWICWKVSFCKHLQVLFYFMLSIAYTNPDNSGSNLCSADYHISVGTTAAFICGDDSLE